MEQIKNKERLYNLYESRREPFRLLADLWASTFVDGSPTEDHYQLAVDAVAQPRKFAELVRQAWFAEAIAGAPRPDIEPFHWELEFLKVFYNEQGRRPDAGFDAVIGNPPAGPRLVPKREEVPRGVLYWPLARKIIFAELSPPWFHTSRS